MNTVSEKIQSSLIDSDTIAESQELLRQRIESTGNWELMSSMERLEFSHKSMLDYMLQNYLSDNLTNERNQIQASLLELNDRTDRMERIRDNASDLYVITRHQLKGDADAKALLEQIISIHKSIKELDSDFADKILSREKYDEMADLLGEELEDKRHALFCAVWTSDAWTHGDMECAANFVTNTDIPPLDTALLISATTLSLTEYFDPRKLTLLLDSYLTAASIEPRLRALVGIVLTLMQYDARITKRYPEISARVKEMSSDSQFTEETFFVVTQLLYSSITDRISTKVNNDLFPAILRGVQFTQNVDNHNIQDILRKAGENPEWSDIKSEKKMEKKLNEITDMLHNGADIYYGTFKTIRNTSFFKRLSHWFYPFSIYSISDKSTKSLINSPNGRFIKLMLNSSALCDTDRYTFCQSLASLGLAMQNTFNETIDEQLRDAGIDLENLKAKSENTKQSNKNIIRFYIFDLYRFFTLHPYKEQFNSPFKPSQGSDTHITSKYMLPSEYQQLHFMYDHADEMLTLADFLMRNGWYEAADDILQQHIDRMGQSADYYQKRGFCNEKMGNNTEAINFYQTANIIRSNSKWTLTHLAALSMQEHDYRTAVEAYAQLADLEPENIKHTFSLATAHHLCGNSKEALEYAYKVYYLDAEYPSVRNLLIDCLLENGDTEKVVEFTIASDHYADTILAALIFICEENYVSAHEMLKTSWQQWANSTDADKPTFHDAFEQVLQRSKFDIKPTIAAMLYDATILR